MGVDVGENADVARLIFSLFSVTAYFEQYFLPINCFRFILHSTILPVSFKGYVVGRVRRTEETGDVEEIGKKYGKKQGRR
jgi:hypothetical protein